MIHRRRRAPEAHAGVRITQYLRSLPGRGLLLRYLVEIEGVRTQWTLEVHPARGRMAMMKERRRSEEPFLADLALECSLRQIGMRLARRRAFDARGCDGTF